MLDPTDVVAVVFDMGGVFVVPHEEPMGRAVAAAGIDLAIDRAGVRRSHYVGVRAITDLLADGDVDEADRDTWGPYDQAYFSALGVPLGAIDAVIAARDDQRRAGVQDVWRHVLDHNVEAFARIAEAYPVGIVTNNDGTAIEQCRAYEICQIGPGALTEVVAIVDSGVIGVSKPDPRIFEPMLAVLDAPPDRVLYVGDTVHADVLGAGRAGMAVVQLDPLELHADHDHWCEPDVVALADRLLA